MDEDDEFASTESPVTVGRVVFCVFLLLPTHNFLYLLTRPRFGAELSEGGMLLSITMLLFSLVLSIIGVLVILRRRSQQKPSLFWFVVTGIALVPTLTFLFAALLS